MKERLGILVKKVRTWSQNNFSGVEWKDSRKKNLLNDLERINLEY